MNFMRLSNPADIEAFIEASDHTCLDIETACSVPDCANAKCKHALEPETARISDIVLGRGSTVVIFSGDHAALLRGLRGTVYLHNFRFDFKMLMRRGGVDLRHLKVYDTMLLDHLLDENEEHSLDAIVQRYWQDNYKEVFWSRYARYEDATPEDALEYACKDVFYTTEVYYKLMSGLRAQDVPDTLINHVHRLALALYDTEMLGLKVDVDYTLTLGTELRTGIEKAEIELREAGGFHCEALELKYWALAIEKAYTPKGKKWQTLPKPDFNFASSAQVSDLLYGQLKLPVVISPKTKRPTVDDAALEKLADLHPIASRLRELRKFQKMYGSFIEGVMDRMHEGRIYPSFNVNGTVTGRISSSNPNMQQIPARGEWAKIRGIFVPEPGHKLITCDYGMLEVVIAAHYSQDANLLKIIFEGASKHDITAEALGVERHTAKTLNFALQYQCSARKVAEIVGCSKDEGEHLYNKYWETYAGEKRVIDECKAKVDRGEPIVNPFGRRRRFPTEFKNKWEKEAAYRQAYSSLIQGTGADLTSAAFYKVAHDVRGLGMGRAWFSIHDEVVVQAKESYLEFVRDMVKTTMVGVGLDAGLSLPLTVDCSEGLDRWEK